MESNEKSNDFETVIYTPYYRGDVYLYHACSGCEYHVKMRVDDTFNTISFGETFKFCPNCGKPVARFVKLPVFLETINRAIFETADAIFVDMENRIKHYLFVELDDGERRTLMDKARFAKSLQEQGGPVAGNGVELILKYSTRKLSHWEKKKLNQKISEAERG